MTAQSASSAQFQEMFEKGAKSAQDGLEQWNKMAQDVFKKAYPSFVDATEEGLRNQKQNIDALTQSATLYMKGAEQISQACWSWCQDIMQDTMSAAKSMMGAKNLKELVDMQSDMAKTCIEKCMAESSKIAEMSMKVANEASQPLQKRANQAMNTASKKAA